MEADLTIVNHELDCELRNQKQRCLLPIKEPQSLFASGTNDVTVGSALNSGAHLAEKPFAGKPHDGI